MESLLSHRLNLLQRLSKHKLITGALFIVVAYMISALLAHFHIIANDWNISIGDAYQVPSKQHWFGTDIFGRSVASKIMKSTETAMSVGVVVSLMAIFMGVVLGAIGGYCGGVIDGFILWICGIIAAIPDIMLLIALTFILGKGIFAVYIALGMTNWVNLCRLIRSEVIRHKDKDYVLAATSIGATHARKLCRHILPNVLHIVIIELSAIFQVAIKSEVILSYLGLGIQDSPSWGVMINDAKVELLSGVWWQITFATLFMFLIVLAFNILSDALRDVLDPKLRGK